MDIVLSQHISAQYYCADLEESTKVIIFCQIGAREKRRRRKTQGIFSYLYL